MLRMVNRRIKKLIAWAIALFVLALMGSGLYFLIMVAPA